MGRMLPLRRMARVDLPPDGSAWEAPFGSLAARSTTVGTHTHPVVLPSKGPKMVGLRDPPLVFPLGLTSAALTAAPVFPKIGVLGGESMPRGAAVLRLVVELRMRRRVYRAKVERVHTCPVVALMVELGVGRPLEQEPDESVGQPAATQFGGHPDVCSQIIDAVPVRQRCQPIPTSRPRRLFNEAIQSD